MIKHISVFFKIFFLLEFAFMGSTLIMWAFFAFIFWIKEGELNFFLLWKAFKGVTLGAIWASLIYWFAYYLWPRFKNRNTF